MVRRGSRRRLSLPRRRSGGRVRKLAIFGGLAAVGAAAWRALRRPTEWNEPSFAPPSTSSGEWGAAPGPSASVETIPPSPEPKPAAEADQTDREIESRADDETKYDRLREQEEAARREAAERLRNDPLVESPREET